MKLDSTRQRFVVIGATASGKSEYAVKLALKKGAPAIISVDARQCYKYLDIGTAKPEKKLLETIPHHYISELEPDEKETAASFRAKCDIWESLYPPEKPLVYVGGSTLYLQALLFNLDLLPETNPTHLETLKELEEQRGLEHLYELLKENDPDYVTRMDGMNKHRIYRALSVWMETRKPFSSFHSAPEEKGFREGFEVHFLQWSREKLYERINSRVDEMIEQGLVREVESLLKRYDASLQSLQTVGYREVISYLNGEIDYAKMIADIKTNTRRYAKRQLTWFRRPMFSAAIPIHSVSSDNIGHIHP